MGRLSVVGDLLLMSVSELHAFASEWRWAEARLGQATRAEASNEKRASIRKKSS